MSNYQPVMGDFNQDGTLNKLWGPNGAVAFDPAPIRAEIGGATAAAQGGAGLFAWTTEQPTSVTLTPVASLLVSGLTSPQLFPSVVGGVAVETNFQYIGCAATQYSQATPRDRLTAQINNSTTTDVGSLNVEFGHIDDQLEIPWCGQSGSIRVLAYGAGGSVVELLRAAPALTTGTAQAGSASTITLASGASATNGTYNLRWVYITSGTGSGSFAPITAYVGATRVATVNPALGSWVTPDATSVYEVRSFKSPFSMPGTTGSIYNILLSFPSEGPRRIRIETKGGAFGGVRTSSTGGVFRVPRVATRRAFVVGDSFTEGTGADFRSTGLGALVAQGLGAEPWVLGSGGTGYLNGSTTDRMTIVDRLTPPLGSWLMSAGGATGGTFTLSYGGQTTSALAFNASSATILAAVQGLSTVGAGNVVVLGVINGVSGIRIPILFRNALANSATPLTMDTSALTGTTNTTAGVSLYAGDIAPYVPTDSSGETLPFDIILLGGHNDSTDNNASFTPTLLQSTVASLIASLQTRFPKASIYMSGVLYVPASQTAAVLAANSALSAAAAASLRKINGYTPFVDTMVPNVWAVGSGNIGSPAGAGLSSQITDIDGVHPSQMGHYWYGARLSAEFLRFKIGY